MTTDESTSLDRLHDVVAPPDIPWWPPAPGWYVVLLILAVLLLRAAWQMWQHWRHDAWRREALSDLQTAASPAAVAALLRRCGLVVASRDRIAELTGDAWVDWLAQQTSVPVPDTVREQLTMGVYGRSDDASVDLPPLKQFATAWIGQLPAEGGPL